MMPFSMSLYLIYSKINGSSIVDGLPYSFSSAILRITLRNILPLLVFGNLLTCMQIIVANYVYFYADFCQLLLNI